MDLKKIFKKYDIYYCNLPIIFINTNVDGDFEKCNERQTGYIHIANSGKGHMSIDIEINEYE